MARTWAEGSKICRGARDWRGSTSWVWPTFSVPYHTTINSRASGIDHRCPLTFSRTLTFESKAHEVSLHFLRSATQELQIPCSAYIAYVAPVGNGGLRDAPLISGVGKVTEIRKGLRTKWFVYG